MYFHSYQLGSWAIWSAQKHWQRQDVVSERVEKRNPERWAVELGIQEAGC